MAALPLQATVTWVVAKTALGAGRGGVTVHAMVVPLPPGSLATVLPAALVARSWLTCVVSVCSLCVTCAFHPLTSLVLAITLVLGSAPPAAAAGLVSLRSAAVHTGGCGHGLPGHLVIVLAPTLPLASGVPSATGSELFGVLPGQIGVTPLAAMQICVSWVAKKRTGGVSCVSNSVPLWTVN